MAWQAAAGEATVVSGKVYDLGKLSFSRDAASIPELRRNDLRMCWIAAGSNLLQHWQDSYLNLHDAGREVPNGIVGPLNIKPYGTGYLAIYREFLKYWTDGGGMNLNALTWWLQGSLAYTPSPQQVEQGGLSVQKTPGGGGYFTNLFGKETDWKPGSAGACGCVVDYGTAPDADLQYAPRTLDDVQRILDEMLQVEGQAGLLAFLDFDNAPQGMARTGAHAITCWGYEKGPDGKLCALYLTDSDDRMLSAFRVNAREQGGAVVMSSNDPSGNYSVFAPGFRVFRALSYIKTPASAARRSHPADSVPQGGVVSANTQISTPLELDSLEVVAAPEHGQTIFTTTASVAVAGGCRVGSGALASMQAGGQGAFSFGSLLNEGQCRLAHAASLPVQDGELVNLGYLDLENVGTVGLGTCECGGCLSMEGKTALELEGLHISPVRADIPAALGLAQLSPQGISRIHGTAQLRNVHITAKNPLLLSGVALSGVVSIQAAAGVQIEDTTLTLGVPQNIRPNALGEIGLSCEKAIIGEARGTLNIRLTAEDASRLASIGVRVIKLRFAPEMHATLVSDQLQPAGDGESFILPPPGN